MMDSVRIALGMRFRVVCEANDFASSHLTALAAIWYAQRMRGSYI